MNWDNVEMIRNAQASAKARFEATAVATQEEIQKVVNSEAAKKITMPRLTEIEQMIFKMRSELIDYIVAHGLVDGLIWDGVLQPIQNGKIVITKEMIEILTEHLGYFTEADVQAFLEMYLPENHYVSDAAYVHTDNNYTAPEKQKLAGIEDGAEVNKIIDLVFNGVSVLDDGTRVATINITPEDIKRWYESNPDTNAFTDAQKAKLAGISDGAEVNRVDDVLVDGRSVLADDKKAKITPDDIKKAYEKNPDTNAFTDAEKADLAALKAWKPEADSKIAHNAAEIAEAKQGISELNDNVTAIGSRVTTLETNTTQLRTDVDSISADAKKHLKTTYVFVTSGFAIPSEVGIFNADFAFDFSIKYADNTTITRTVHLSGIVSAKHPSPSVPAITITGTLLKCGGASFSPKLVLRSDDRGVQYADLSVDYVSEDPEIGSAITSITCDTTPTATYQKIDTVGEIPTGGLIKVDSPENADFAVVTLKQLKHPDMSARLDVMTYGTEGWSISTEDVPYKKLIANEIIGHPITLAKTSSKGGTNNCFSVPSYKYISNNVYEGNGFFLKCDLPTQKANWSLAVAVGGCTMNRNSKTAKLVADNLFNVATGDDSDTYMKVDFYKVN